MPANFIPVLIKVKQLNYIHSCYLQNQSTSHYYSSVRKHERNGLMRQEDTMTHIYFIVFFFFLAIDAKTMGKFAQLHLKLITDFKAEDIISHRSYSQAPHQ